MDIPSNTPKFITESEISLEPIVSHHTIKKGLSIVKINPIRMGFSILILWLIISRDLVNFLSFRIDLICKNEKIIMKIPPITPINLKSTSDREVEEKDASILYDNAKIKGNSMRACPVASFNPISDPYLLPYRRLIKNKGPGDNTPVVDTNMT